MMLTKIEKCTGAMLASAIGDALGWPNERRARNVLQETVPAEKYSAWHRSHRWPFLYAEEILPGEYSDDTQLILSVARSLIYGDWENYFSKNELTFWLEYERGGGGALLRAAKLYRKGLLPWSHDNARDYFRAGGNGAAMRILPHIVAAIAVESNVEDVICDVVRNSIITHGHPRAILGATCYAFALSYLGQKDTILDYKELVYAILEGSHIWGEFPGDYGLSGWIDSAVKFSGYDYERMWQSVLVSMVRQFSFIADSLDKGLLTDDSRIFYQIGCTGNANGAGDVAILTAVYLASKYANHPELGVKIPATFIGMDTDTIASITGGLLGMIHGTSWIPNEWHKVQDYECIALMTELLFAKDMKRKTRLHVDSVKTKHSGWENTPIGEMRLISTNDILTGKSSKVTLHKWETALGQSLYMKEITRDHSMNVHEKQMQFHFAENEQSCLTKLDTVPKLMPNFTLFQQDIERLLSNPLMKRITFNKVIRIASELIAGNNDTACIAKTMKVDEQIVRIVQEYTVDKQE